jgi:hypothetical protein
LKYCHEFIIFILYKAKIYFSHIIKISSGSKINIQSSFAW